LFKDLKKIADKIIGCLSVHSSETKNLNYFSLIPYLLTTLGLGKWPNKKWAFMLLIRGFSFKGRGFCPSCGGRRMSELAAFLVL